MLHRECLQEHLSYISEILEILYRPLTYDADDQVFLDILEWCNLHFKNWRELGISYEVPDLVKVKDSICAWAVRDLMCGCSNYIAKDIVLSESRCYKEWNMYSGSNDLYYDRKVSSVEFIPYMVCNVQEDHWPNW